MRLPGLIMMLKTTKTIVVVLMMMLMQIAGNVVVMINSKLVLGVLVVLMPTILALDWVITMVEA